MSSPFSLSSSSIELMKTCRIVFISHQSRMWKLYRSLFCLVCLQFPSNIPFHSHNMQGAGYTCRVYKLQGFIFVNMINIAFHVGKRIPQVMISHYDVVFITLGNWRINTYVYSRWTFSNGFWRKSSGPHLKRNGFVPGLNMLAPLTLTHPDDKISMFES